VIVFNEAGLLRLMARYCSYHERFRTHLSLHKDTPIPRPVTPLGDGCASPILRPAKIIDVGVASRLTLARTRSV
jgi:hypothetical protein